MANKTGMAPRPPKKTKPKADKKKKVAMAPRPPIKKSPKKGKKTQPC